MFDPEQKDEGCRYNDGQMAHEMALTAAEEFRYYKGWTPTKEQVAKLEEAIKSAFPDREEYERSLHPKKNYDSRVHAIKMPPKMQKMMSLYYQNVFFKKDD